MKHLNEVQWALERRLNREKLDLKAIHRIRLRGVRSNDGQMFYYVEGKMSPIYKKERNLWRIASMQGGNVVLQAGGEVVGAIPTGLPAMQSIPLNWDMLQKLLMTALALALIGFMESASTAKHIASESRERLDMNQELIGQGMAKMLGALFQSMPVSGGFSRSVLNYYSGVKTGFSSVVAGLGIMLILLWLTPLFYYLPIPTLAAVIVYTALKLFDLDTIRRAFLVSKNEGFVAVGTFVLTLLMAPRIEVAVMLGVVLSLLVHLNDTMRTTFFEMVRDENNEFIEADASTAESQFCYLISVVRIRGSLYFAKGDLPLL